MRTIVLSALFALGLALAGFTGTASAAPAAPGYTPVPSANTLLEQVQYRRWHRCHRVRVCRWTPYGRRCHWRRVCRW